MNFRAFIFAYQLILYFRPLLGTTLYKTCVSKSTHRQNSFIFVANFIMQFLHYAKQNPSHNYRRLRIGLF